MSKYFALCFCLLLLGVRDLSAQEGKVELTFDQALHIMNGDNNSLKIAEHEIEWAKSERQRMNSFWYPKVIATGAYTHFSNKIEVRQSMSSVTDPIKNLIHEIDPNEQLVTGLLNKFGQNYLSVPLMPQNTTTVDALVTYPIFTGGKRIYASKIGKQIVKEAEISKERISAEQRVLLVSAYFGVRLQQQVLVVKGETFNSLEKHYQNALKLEANGMLTKAERLFFEVNRDEAKREVEVALKELTIAQDAFRNLVKIDSAQELQPTTSLFINGQLPPLTYFRDLIADKNYTVSALNLKKDIQNNQIKIANAAYVPNIELFGKQNVYSHGIDKYLVPRSMVGVGFTWNIFDGLDREKKVKQAKIEKAMTEIETDQTINDLGLAVNQFYTQTQIALDNVTALKTTVKMSKELVRARQKSFVEGMATPTEVVDAELMLSKVRLTSLLAYFQFDVNLINLLAICGIPETFSEYNQLSLDEGYVLN